MVSLVENLYYIERKRGVWGAEPPSAAGEKLVAGAEKFWAKVKKDPPFVFGKIDGRGEFLANTPDSNSQCLWKLIKPFNPF